MNDSKTFQLFTVLPSPLATGTIHVEQVKKENTAYVMIMFSGLARPV